jgi:beta-lactam-binding protein with PASTA domain
MLKVRRKSRRRPRTVVAPAEETAVIVEEVGPPAPPPLPPGELPSERELWPWMLVLLALVLVGLAAAYFVARDDKKGAKSTTVTTTLAQTVAPAPARTTTPKAAPKPAAPVRTAVPKLIGMPAPAALQTLKKLGLSGTTRGVFSTKPRNRVVSQKPGAGTKLSKGAVVLLNVSKGPKAVPIPDVVGQEEAAAISTVRAQGFVADVARVPSDQPAGQVVAQHPIPGTKAAPGSGVRLNVSTGPKKSSNGTGTSTKPVASPPASTSPTTTTTSSPAPAPATVTVPDVTGKKLLAARKLIRKAELVTEFKRVPNDLPKGTVVSQSPHPGETAKRGAHVLLNVSLGPKPTAGAEPIVPDVTGQDEATATQDLQAAGYQVEVARQDTTDPAEDGVVVNQDPPAGQAASAKSKVTIYVGRFSG